MILAIALAGAGCGARRAPPLFGSSGVEHGSGASTRVDVDGHWSWISHAGNEAEGRLTRERLVRFERLLALAELGVDITCDPNDHEQRDPKVERDRSRDGQTLSVSDYARDRHATYVAPCLAPDPSTQRVLDCLTSVMYASDDLYEEKCRLPLGE